MTCPFAKYTDKGWLDYEWHCKCSGEKIGSNHNPNYSKVETLCKKDFSKCPYYKANR